MKFVDLAERLQEVEVLPIKEIARVLAGVCDQVQLLHESGQVHKDIKPENILISEINRVYLVDFGQAGLSRAPGEIAVYTSDGVIRGAVDYVSPEYIKETSLDLRADIYAIGVLGYRAITGHFPFDGDTVYSRMTARLDSPAPRPSSLRKDCPESLDKVIEKSLQPDADLRYQSAVEMRNAILKVLEGLGEKVDHFQSQPSIR